MKNEERNELTKKELERVVGGRKGIGVMWSPKTGEAEPVGRVIPRRRRIKQFEDEPLEGGAVGVDINLEK